MNNYENNKNSFGYNDFKENEYEIPSCVEVVDIVIPDNCRMDFWDKTTFIKIPSGVKSIKNLQFISGEKVYGEVINYLSIPSSVIEIGNIPAEDIKTLILEKDSFAEKWAKEHNRDFFYSNEADVITYSLGKLRLLFVEKGSYSENWALKNQVPYLYIGEARFDEDIGIILKKSSESEKLYKKFQKEMRNENYDYYYEKEYDSMFTWKDAAKFIDKNLKVVEIPEKYHRIAKHAFAFPNGIEEVHLHGSLTDLGDYCFENCQSLKKIVTDGTENYLQSINIGVGAFKGCSSLEEITFGPDCSTIFEDAFRKCINLKTVTFEYDSIEVQTGAFLESGLKKVYLNNDLNEIGPVEDGAFPDDIELL